MFNNYIYKGAIHIHSNNSDGSGNLNQIIRAAKKANLDWIIVTDHNYYDTNEGIFDGLYVIKGEEISPKNCNHYLAFNINETISPDDNPSCYVNKVRELGGFGFAAHPDEGFTQNKEGEIVPRKNSHHCIPWTDKNIKPDGIEIWNWFSNWADNLDDRNIFTLAYAYLFKHNIIKSPSKTTLKWWDELNNESPEIVPALGGVDAHALKFYKYIIPVTVFPYETCFNTITNFININNELSKDFQIAKQQILNAIKNGNNIIANRYINNMIPEIYVTNSKNSYYCGNEIDLDDSCFLQFISNTPMKICLIYNGNIQECITSDKYTYKITTAGKYRLEVFFKEKGFLYTNPFNII